MVFYTNLTRSRSLHSLYYFILFYFFFASRCCDLFGGKDYLLGLWFVCSLSVLAFCFDAARLRQSLACTTTHPGTLLVPFRPPTRLIAAADCLLDSRVVATEADSKIKI